ncbi:MAG: sugar transferase [Otoolea sp.]
MFQQKRTIENMLLPLLDALCVLISMLAAFQLRYHSWLGINWDWDQLWLLPMLLGISVLAEMIFDYNRHFFRRGYFEELISVLKAQLVLSMCWVLILYLMHRASLLSRLVFGYFAIVNTVITYLMHLLVKQYLLKIYRTSKYSNRMLIATTAERVSEVVENIARYNEWNRLITGLVILDEERMGDEIEGIPIVSGAADFMEYVIHHDVDEVFLSDPQRLNSRQVRSWIQELETMGIIVNVDIDIFNLDIHGKRTLNRVGKYAVVTFARNLLSSRELVMKRVLDVAGSLVGMVILGIATIFVAPAIKLESPGPVFFGQTRIGKNGRKFTFYKFRSMYQDAEQRKKELMAQNEVQGLMFKMKDDPRITKVGKFIRKTSIDELPQFWNVLKGDMSLVGTRPPTVDEFEQYEAKHKCRLSMTPGLTGMWQISGRSDITDFDEVVKLDMQYIDNWTILKDIKILIMTVIVVLKGKGSR